MAFPDPRWESLGLALVSSIGGLWRDGDGVVEIEFSPETSAEDGPALLGLGVCLGHLSRPVVLDARRVRPPHLDLLELVTAVLKDGPTVTVRNPSPHRPRPRITRTSHESG
ncbi:hypothetical protein [Lapillicoccus sp.]|uniref:hypothetical protein n=1 Tax=Lapillicoccus sp. TaxID=1909287 RepID=UPI00398333F8